MSDFIRREDAIKALESVEAASVIDLRRGTYQCFHCGTQMVVWDCDFDASDYGYDEPGIVHDCHCENCGAQITYFVPSNIDYRKRIGCKHITVDGRCMKNSEPDYVEWCVEGPCSEYEEIQEEGE